MFSNRVRYNLAGSFDGAMDAADKADKAREKAQKDKDAQDAADNSPVEGQTNAEFTPAVSQAMLDQAAKDRVAKAQADAASAEARRSTIAGGALDNGTVGGVSAPQAVTAPAASSMPTIGGKVGIDLAGKIASSGFAPAVSQVNALGQTPITAQTVAIDPTKTATNLVSKVDDQLGFLKTTPYGSPTAQGTGGLGYTGAVEGNVNTTTAAQGLSDTAIKAAQANQAGVMSNELLQAIQNQALGKTAAPSVAELQLQQATQANIAAQQAAAANQRGQFNPALLRSINQQAATTNQEAAGQAALLRAGEQQKAQELAANLGTTIAGQNISAAQTEQKLKTETELANTAAKNQRFSDVMNTNTQRLIAANQNALAAATNDADRAQRMTEIKFQAEADAAKDIRQATLEATKDDAAADIAVKEFNAKMTQDAAVQAADLMQKAVAGDNASKQALENAKQQAFQYWIARDMTIDQLNAEWAKAQGTWANNLEVAKLGVKPEPTFLDKFVGPALIAGGTIAGAIYGGPAGAAAGNAVGGAVAKGVSSDGSDKRIKHDIKDAKILPFLDSLESKSFKYNEGKGPEGQRYGFLAQDLEKTPQGKSLVYDAGEGEKHINIPQATLMMMAAMAEMNNKIKKMEGKK